MTNRTRNPSRGVSRRTALKGAGTLAMAGVFAGFPNVARGAGKVIRAGMPTILSGRVALVGVSSSAGALMEIDKFNAAGGINGRTIELVVRDSKGKPDEAAKVTRDLVNIEGCEVILDAEASSGAFAVHEVIRELGVYCIHMNSETSQLTADPKLHVPTAFRSARQGVHDSVGGGEYAAAVAKKKGLKRWLTCSPDYAYGRDTTAEFIDYVKMFNPEVEIVDQTWPKLFEPDYNAIITKILQVKPQAMFTTLWGGDLSTFIDQSNIYGLMQQIETFAVNLGDYSVLKAVKQLPKGIHAGTRYNRLVPNNPANLAFYEAYTARFKDHLPVNWSWENATGAAFLIEALKKTGGNTEGKKLAEATAGAKINSPFGVDGTLTMREGDHTLTGYVVGYGISQATDPYLSDVWTADWGKIFELEKAWKKQKGYA